MHQPDKQPKLRPNKLLHLSAAHVEVGCLYPGNPRCDAPPAERPPTSGLPFFPPHFRSLRYFARQQLGTDAFGCTVGACVYLGLIHTMLSQGRPELAAATLLVFPFALWPQLLARLGLREVHVRYRDYLLLLQ